MATGRIARQAVTDRIVHRAMVRDVCRMVTDRTVHRAIARDVHKMATDRIARREITETTDSAELQTEQETDRTRDRDVRETEEETASRTAGTEEITVITETEEICVMVDAVMTERNPARLFHHLQSQNRSQAATNQKMRIRKKITTEMKRMKTDCRKAKRARITMPSRRW